MFTIDQEARKTDLRNSYLASFFQHVLETAQFSLPLSVTAEQEAAFKAALAERVARVEMQANETFTK